jgi:acetylxylan esterase
MNMNSQLNAKPFKFDISAFIVSLLILSIWVMTASAGTFKQITNFGNNPSDLQMYIYVPTNVKAHPPILVVPHACHGTAMGMNGSSWNTQADQYGFIIIYPGNLSSKDSCWDVHSTASLTHNGGSDPLGMVSMVKYVEQNYNGDSTRVYAAGYSSGGMMTNVLLGSYPDIFKAGAAFAGVAFGCFGAGPVDSYGWCSSCATGQIIKTAAQWGDLVRAAYPGYTGPRPKMQLWHGSIDNVVYFPNLGEEIKQWTNVLDASITPADSEPNQPEPTWTLRSYTNSSGQTVVQAIVETGLSHGNLDVRADLAVTWLGLDKATAIENGNGPLINVNGQNAEVRIVRHYLSNSVSFVVPSFLGHIGLDVYNLSGKKIYTIAEQFDAGTPHQFSWDGRINGAAFCPAGVYVLSVKVNGMVAASYRFAFLANR